MVGQTGRNRATVGVYVPTKKNDLVRTLYERLGFSRCGSSNHGQIAYELRLTMCTPPKSFVKPKETPFRRSSVVELNKFAFWFVCGTAGLLLVPVSSLALRKWIQAGTSRCWSSCSARTLSGCCSPLRSHTSRFSLSARQDTEPCLRRWWELRRSHCLFCTNCRKRRQPGGGRLGADPGRHRVFVRGAPHHRSAARRFRAAAPGAGSVSLINYLLPFHMLAAGPIQSFDDFMKHAEERFEPTAKTVLIGFELIASGLFMKFVLADLLQKLFLTNFESSGLYFFLEMQLTFVWVYLDFSAYSYIALGIGMLLGISTPVNFNRPLLARNLIDFWERWHISLSLFIRRNLFIPLQVYLMRQNEGRTPLLSAAIAISVSFVLCGLWHGLGAGFLIWGMIQAGGSIATRVYGHALQSRLGKDGLRSYLANPWYRTLAIFATFQVQAVALLA